MLGNLLQSTNAGDDDDDDNDDDTWPHVRLKRPQARCAAEPLWRNVTASTCRLGGTCSLQSVSRADYMTTHLTKHGEQRRPYGWISFVRSSECLNGVRECSSSYCCCYLDKRWTRPLCQIVLLSHTPSSLPLPLRMIQARIRLRPRVKIFATSRKPHIGL